MTTKRKTIPDKLKSRVLLRSKRRCCLCFEEGKRDPREGTIARLDQTIALDEGTEDNLVFLCLSHHMTFDQNRISVDLVREARQHLYSTLGESSAPQQAESFDSFAYEQRACNLLENLFRKSLKKDVTILFSPVLLGRSGCSRHVDFSAEFGIAGLRFRVIAEIRRRSSITSAREIDSLASIARDVGAHKAMLVCMEGFSDAAFQLARASGIALIHLTDDTIELSEAHVLDDLAT